VLFSNYLSNNISSLSELSAHLVDRGLFQVPGPTRTPGLRALAQLDTPDLANLFGPLQYFNHSDVSYVL
jgi:hypothetical protein